MALSSPSTDHRRSSFFAHVALSRERLLDRTYTRDKDGKFATSGGPGSGRDMTSDHAALREILESTTDQSGHWAERDKWADDALVEVARRQGFDAQPTIVPAAQFDSYVRDGGHTALYRGVKGNEDGTAADIHAEIREGPYHPGLGIFGNGFYMAPDSAKAETFADGSPGSLGRYALHREARTITYSELLDRYGKTFNSPEWDSIPAPTKSVISDPGRYAAALGFDAIRVPVGTRMTGGNTVQREEYVILNRGALVAEEP